MYWDHDVAHAKEAPAPGQYVPKRINDKVKGSVAMKNERVSYVDEAIRAAKDNLTAPGLYTAKVL